MIVSVDTLKTMEEFKDIEESVLTRKMTAIESLIRAYTNNTFQNRHVRFEAASEGAQVFGLSPFLSVGDTVQITKSDVNNGLYTICEISDEGITVNKE